MDMEAVEEEERFKRLAFMKRKRTEAAAPLPQGNRKKRKRAESPASVLQNLEKIKTLCKEAEGMLQRAASLAYWDQAFQKEIKEALESMAAVKASAEVLLNSVRASLWGPEESVKSPPPPPPKDSSSTTRSRRQRRRLPPRRPKPVNFC